MSIEPLEKYEFIWQGKKAAAAEADKPSQKILIPCRDESRAWDTTGNLYIEGENLDALKLLQDQYLGAVRVIYIDPPYNTGNDFIYHDEFAHSGWCSMMYMRLLVSRRLLAENGVVFISIDENEQANLKKICDEVFGEENYLNQFVWVSNLTGRQIAGHGAAKTWESIFAYAKNIAYAPSLTVDVEFAKEKMPDAYKGFHKDIRTDAYGSFAVGDALYNHNRRFNEETRPTMVFSIFYNPETGEIETGDIGQTMTGFVELLPHANGDGIHRYHAWRWSRKKIARESRDLIVLPTSNGGYEIYTKIRNYSTTLLKDIITNIPNGDTELRKLFEGKKYFDYPKSTDLMKVLVGAVDDKEALVLDFFSGSATTAEAVMQMNAEDKGRRRFIMVQIPEACDEKSEAYKDGYLNICEIGKERIRRAGDKIKAGHSGKHVFPDIGFKVLKLASPDE